jgi:tetraacyldisaccharide 4'-kinase
LRLHHLDEPSWWYREGPSVAAAALAPLAALYGWAAEARFARAKPYRSRLPVICVGNLTAGGTGKTPLTLYLCAHLQASSRRPAVLTRGYGGAQARPRWVAEGDGADAVGDEALLLARAAPTMVARDRAAGAQAIEAAIDAGMVAADVIVMDDGLQNPQLGKNLTLAVVDGGRGLGNGRVMPAGPLRAPLAFQLGLVDALIVNQPAAGTHSASVDAVADGLRRRFAGPVLRCSTIVAGDAAWLRGRRVVAWAGIGAPQRFFGLLRALGAETAETVAFADHERLAEADARRLLALAGRHRATLVTTAKDMARLTGATGSPADLAAATRVVPIALALPEPDAERLARLVGSAIEARRR